MQLRNLTYKEIECNLIKTLNQNNDKFINNGTNCQTNEWGLRYQFPPSGFNIKLPPTSSFITEQYVKDIYQENSQLVFLPQRYNYIYYFLFNVKLIVIRNY